MNEPDPKFHEVARRVLELKQLDLEIFSTFRKYDSVQYIDVRIYRPPDGDEFDEIVKELC